MTEPHITTIITGYVPHNLGFSMIKQFFNVLKAYKETETVYQEVTDTNRLRDASILQMEAERELAETFPAGTYEKMHFLYNGRTYLFIIGGLGNYHFDDITPDRVIDFSKTDPESDPEVPKTDPESPLQSHDLLYRPE